MENKISAIPSGGPCLLPYFRRVTRSGCVGPVIGSSAGWSWPSRALGRGTRDVVLFRIRLEGIEQDSTGSRCAGIITVKHGLSDPNPVLLRGAARGFRL